MFLIVPLSTKSHYVADPPSDHRLSDALVFLIISQNTVAARYRHARWPADFDCAGDIYADRWPMGHPVILWAFGIPFVAVYANYYIMRGSSCRPHIWLLTKKPGHYQLSNCFPNDNLGDSTSQLCTQKRRLVSQQRKPGTFRYV